MVTITTTIKITIIITTTITITITITMTITIKIKITITITLQSVAPAVGRLLHQTINTLCLQAIKLNLHIIRVSEGHDTGPVDHYSGIVDHYPLNK